MERITINVLVFTLVILVILPSMAIAGDPAIENREEIMRSLRMLGLRAQEYYQTPIYEGGGGGSFEYIFLGILTQTPQTGSGTFVLSAPTGTSLMLEGTGNEIGEDGSTPVHGTVTVYADSLVFTVDN